jgi:hypothetical protein
VKAKTRKWVVKASRKKKKKKKKKRKKKNILPTNMHWTSDPW